MMISSNTFFKAVNFDFVPGVCKFFYVMQAWTVDKTFRTSGQPLKPYDIAKLQMFNVTFRT